MMIDLKLAVLVLGLVAISHARNVILSDSRIVGGEIVKDHRYPFLVAITENLYHICSGFIYSKDWIVTTASCVKDIPSRFLEITVAQISYLELDQDEKDYSVSIVEIHPDYSPDTGLHDIAMLGVTDSIVFGPNVYFVKYDEELPEPKTGTVMGWGALNANSSFQSTSLREANVTIQGDCQPYGPKFNQDFMICAGVESDEAGPCFDDEGSPLIQGGVVIGIMSQHRECGEDPYYSSLYTRLSTHFRWMQGIAGFQPTNTPAPPTDPGVEETTAASVADIEFE